jgi:hypothetical protein
VREIGKWLIENINHDGSKGIGSAPLDASHSYDGLVVFEGTTIVF